MEIDFIKQSLNSNFRELDGVGMGGYLATLVLTTRHVTLEDAV